MGKDTALGERLPQEGAGNHWSKGGGWYLGSAFANSPVLVKSRLTADFHRPSPCTNSQDAISKVKRLQLPLGPRVDSGDGAASWRGWWVGGISGMDLNTAGPGNSLRSPASKAGEGGPSMYCQTEMPAMSS